MHLYFIEFQGRKFPDLNHKLSFEVAFSFFCNGYSDLDIFWYMKLTFKYYIANIDQ